MPTIIIHSTISVLLLCLCILANMNNIRLTTALLKEATKALFEVRMMSVVPIGALFSSTVILLIFYTVRFYLLTYGKLTEISPGFLRYVPDHLMPTAIIFSFIMAIWTILFVLGVQYITVSGAVAQWYTAKDLGSLNDSIPSNFRATIKYHLGTLALGSVMMTIMFVPRLILQFLAMFSALKRKADSWLRCLDGFFTTNSYIITAICGTSFIQSGKRARDLLKFSVGGTRDVNSFANFVILFAQISIVSVSTFAMHMFLKLLHENSLQNLYQRIVYILGGNLNAQLVREEYFRNFSIRLTPWMSPLEKYNYYIYGWDQLMLLELAIAYVYVHAIIGNCKD